MTAMVNITSITDANSNVTDNTYDTTFHKFLEIIENDNGDTTQFSYDARYAQITSTKTQYGLVEEVSEYDVLG